MNNLNNSDLQRRKNTIRVFACGGAGANLGMEFERYRKGSDAGFASLEVSYIDTSISNLSPALNRDHCYIIDKTDDGEPLDGSGKQRAENFEAISGRILDILQQHRPADLNIVISSGGGGSGSVIAPSLVSELLGKNAPVVVVVIGSVATDTDVTNSMKTLKSYEAIALRRDAGIALAYMENNQQTTRKENDKNVHRLVISLSALFSGENRELDTADLRNFLRFERLNKFPAGVVSLTTVNSAEDSSNLGHVVTVATLATDPDHADFVAGTRRPHYQCIGYLPSDMNEDVRRTAPLHFVTSDGVIQGIVKRLEKLADEGEEADAARITRRSILSEADKVTRNGLVL